MNENVRKWVEALRSGEYKQATHQLRGFTPSRDDIGYCCLGVACEVYRHETGEGKWDGLDQFILPSGASLTSLPRTVREWLGVQTPEGEFGREEPLDDNYGTLVDRNDEGWTFTEIADLIESNPTGLFVD